MHTRSPRRARQKGARANPREESGECSKKENCVKKTRTSGLTVSGPLNRERAPLRSGTKSG